MLDLELICKQGFDYLQLRIPAAQRRLVASEAVGLPIVVQQVCHNLLEASGIEYVDESRYKALSLSEAHVERSLNNVARQKYTQFESYYNTIIRGPREKARKYRTYELVLACFTLNPIKFALRRPEIDARMNRLKIGAGEIPPAASLNSTFGALKKFQERRQLDLLEWRQAEETLYIIEPAFLFYVRWRSPRETQITQLDLFEQLFSLASRRDSSEGA